MKKIAIIGGTGWDENSLKSTFDNCSTRTITTKWGNARVVQHHENDRQLFFLHRHVAPERTTHLPPHRINYRANIAALHSVGVEHIFAAFSVGGLHADWHSGNVALLQQIIDMTSGRESTFYEEEPVHTDMTNPLDERGTAILSDAARQHGFTIHQNATYICTNGPRFETSAEIRLFANWGADVVGMTLMPEVTLANELAIPYSAIAVITNAAAGISPAPLTHQEVNDVMECVLPRLTKVLLSAAMNH